MTDPAEAKDIEPSPEADDEDPGWPLSFILLVVAGGLYLVLRFFQMARGLLA
jgi:hypothetical protein